MQECRYKCLLFAFTGRNVETCPVTDSKDENVKDLCGRVSFRSGQWSCSQVPCELQATYICKTETTTLKMKSSTTTAKSSGEFTVYCYERF